MCVHTETATSPIMLCHVEQQCLIAMSNPPKLQFVTSPQDDYYKSISIFVTN